MTRKLACIIIFSCITSAFANPIIPIPTQPQTPIFTPNAPEANAGGYILMDADSGKILDEKNADKHMAPASLTKLMTMYVISTALKSGNIHYEDKVRISNRAWQTGGSRMFLKPNTDVSVRDLIQGIIVDSGNDATVAMAEFLAGTEDAFATLMNAQAKTLGMKNSHFVDSNGLPNPNHYSSPRDLAILAQAIIKNYPEDYKIYSEKWFTYNNIRQPNRNRLLWVFPDADGLKTGHTAEAGYCLVGSAKKNGTRMISVVMNAPSDPVRTEESIKMLTYGFRFFETHKLFAALTTLTHARVWKGIKKEVPLGVAEDFHVTLPNGQYKNVQTDIHLNEPIQAPVSKGSIYGKVNVMLNNQTVASMPLIALTDDERGGFFHSIADTFRYGYKKLFSKSTEKANNG